MTHSSRKKAVSEGHAKKQALDRGGGISHERSQPGRRLISCETAGMGTRQRMNYGAVWREMGSGQIYYAPFPLCWQVAQSQRYRFTRD